jgi:hypothetical protein
LPPLAAAEITAPLAPAVPVVEWASAEISAPCPWLEPLVESAPPRFPAVEVDVSPPPRLRPSLATAAISAHLAAPADPVVCATDDTAAPCVPDGCPGEAAGAPCVTPSDCSTPFAVSDAAAGRPAA